jgi:hypothetical protein
MNKPIPNKPEVAPEHVDEPHVRAFEETTCFDTHLDEAGILLNLHHIGTVDLHTSARIHFHYALFAEILHDLATKVDRLPRADSTHREALRNAAKALYVALSADADGSKGGDDFTPDEEVLVLHVME